MQKSPKLIVKRARAGADLGAKTTAKTATTLVAKTATTFAIASSAAALFATSAAALNSFELHNISAAHQMGITGNGTVVAIVDGGYDEDHPLLESNILELVKNNYWSNYPSHGSHVAGIIAATQTNNASYGIAYNAKILGYGNIGSGVSWAQYNKILEYGAKIVSNSHTGWYGMLGQLAKNNNVLLVYATGNDRSLSPNNAASHGIGSSDNIAAAVSVGNINAGAISRLDNGTLKLTANAFGSNKGNWCLGASNYCVLASGTGIYSLDNGGGHTYKTGTSMSAPVVSGIAALVAERFSFLNGKQIGDVILSTADKDYELPKLLIRGKYVVYVDNEIPRNADGTQNEEQIRADIAEVYGAGIAAAAQLGSVVSYTREEIFGQGIVNAGAAMLGLKTIDINRLSQLDVENLTGREFAFYTIDTQGASGLFEHDIDQRKWQDKYQNANAIVLIGEHMRSLDAGLRKQGEGTLGIAGSLLYKGATVVEGGELAFSHKSANSNLDGAAGENGADFGAAGAGGAVNNISVAGDLWVNASAALTSAAGVNVATNGSLTNFGRVELRGDFAVGGAVANHNTTRAYGDFAAGGALDNGGQMVVSGELAVDGDAQSRGYLAAGTLDVAGSLASSNILITTGAFGVGGDFANGGVAMLALTGSGAATINGSANNSGSLTYAGGAFSVGGDLTSRGAFNAYANVSVSGAVANSGYFVAGGNLAAGGELANEKTLRIGGVVGVGGAATNNGELTAGALRVAGTLSNSRSLAVGGAVFVGGDFENAGRAVFGRSAGVAAAKANLAGTAASAETAYELAIIGGADGPNSNLAWANASLANLAGADYGASSNLINASANGGIYGAGAGANSNLASWAGENYGADGEDKDYGANGGIYGASGENYDADGASENYGADGEDKDYGANGGIYGAGAMSNSNFAAATSTAAAKTLANFTQYAAAAQVVIVGSARNYGTLATDHNVAVGGDFANYGTLSLGVAQTAHLAVAGTYKHAANATLSLAFFVDGSANSALTAGSYEVSGGALIYAPLSASAQARTVALDLGGLQSAVGNFTNVSIQSGHALKYSLDESGTKLIITPTENIYADVDGGDEALAGVLRSMSAASVSEDYDAFFANLNAVSRDAYDVVLADLTQRALQNYHLRQSEQLLHAQSQSALDAVRALRGGEGAVFKPSFTTLSSDNTKTKSYKMSLQGNWLTEFGSVGGYLSYESQTSDFAGGDKLDASAKIYGGGFGVRGRLDGGFEVFGTIGAHYAKNELETALGGAKSAEFNALAASVVAGVGKEFEFGAASVRASAFLNYQFLSQDEVKDSGGGVDIASGGVGGVVGGGLFATTSEAQKSNFLLASVGAELSRKFSREVSANAYAYYERRLAGDELESSAFFNDYAGQKFTQKYELGSDFVHFGVGVNYEPRGGRGYYVAVGAGGRVGFEHDFKSYNANFRAGYRF